MKVISWNLNGVASCVHNHSFDAISELNPDVICCQEIRTQQEFVVMDGYRHFWFHSNQGGYSGTLVMTKDDPISVRYGFGEDYYAAMATKDVLSVKFLLLSLLCSDSTFSLFIIVVLSFCTKKPPFFLLAFSSYLR